MFRTRASTFSNHWFSTYVSVQTVKNHVFIQYISYFTLESLGASWQRGKYRSEQIQDQCSKSETKSSGGHRTKVGSRKLATIRATGRWATAGPTEPSNVWEPRQQGDGLMSDYCPLRHRKATQSHPGSETLLTRWKPLTESRTPWHHYLLGKWIAIVVLLRMFVRFFISCYWNLFRLFIQSLILKVAGSSSSLEANVTFLVEENTSNIVILDSEAIKLISTRGIWKLECWKWFDMVDLIEHTYSMVSRTNFNYKPP